MAGRYLESRSAFSVASSLSDGDGTWGWRPWTVTSMEISPLMECVGRSIASDLIHKTKRDSLVLLGAYHDPGHVPRGGSGGPRPAPEGPPPARQPATASASASFSA